MNGSRKEFVERSWNLILLFIFLGRRTRRFEGQGRHTYIRCTASSADEEQAVPAMELGCLPFARGLPWDGNYVNWRSACSVLILSASWGQNQRTGARFWRSMRQINVEGRRNLFGREQSGEVIPRNHIKGGGD